MRDFVVITGFSGAGKSQAMACFENAGYFCVDNLPPEMIGQLADLFQHEGSRVENAAVVSDVRGGLFFDGLVGKARHCDFRGRARGSIAALGFFLPRHDQRRAPAQRQPALPLPRRRSRPAPRPLPLLDAQDLRQDASKLLSAEQAERYEPWLDNDKRLHHVSELEVLSPGRQHRSHAPDAGAQRPTLAAATAGGGGDPSGHSRAGRRAWRG